jgi:prepilin-type N-terminal cleavage/methylation domain-containing protein
VKKRISSRHRGFTLIELLIVIAIIAILALIAIPNFLEAQVRSRVSRAMSDMRSEATAMHLYTVDYGRAPVDQNEYTNVFGRGPYGQNICLRVLTTPVAYMSSLPIDIFVDRGSMGPDQKSVAPAGQSFIYEYTYAVNPAYAAIGGIPQQHKDLQGWAVQHGYTWAIYSLGPARARNPIDLIGAKAYMGVFTMLGAKDGEAGVSAGKFLPYDPTNGTTSYGFIIETNKGFFTDRQ